MFRHAPVALTEQSRYARRDVASSSTQSIGTKAMTSFDKREEAFEQQFAHDEELRFKATARRNKLAGLWAAEKLGLSGAEANSYALSIVMDEIDGKESAASKIRKDFDAKGVAQSDHQIGRVMNDLMEMAMADIRAGK
jgi:hypothetical protein